MGFLDDTRKILKKIDLAEVAAVTEIVKSSRRVFTVGNGGGAAHASHFAADLRGMMGKEAYCVNDNVAAISAAENDFGWEHGFRHWLNRSRLNQEDCLFVFSVGGGEDGVSANISNVFLSATWLAPVVGIVGRGGGLVRKYGTTILIPSDSTPQVEGIQSVLAHMIACS